MDQTALAHQSVFRNFRERGEDTNLDRGLSLLARRYREEGTPSRPIHAHAPPSAQHLADR